MNLNENDNNLCELDPGKQRVDSTLLNDVDDFCNSSIPSSKRTTETSNVNPSSETNILEKKGENQVEVHQVVIKEELTNSKAFIENSVPSKIAQEEKEQNQESKQTETKKEIPKVLIDNLPPSQKILSKRVGDKVYVVYQDIKTRGFKLFRFTMTNPKVHSLDYSEDEYGIIRYNEPLSSSSIITDFHKYYDFLASLKNG